MGIIKKIKDNYSLYKSKQKEVKLIRSDDRTIVEELTGEGDNSGIDIVKIVKSMDDPNEMAKVVRDNLGEIIDQDNVKETLKYLNDSDIAKIMDENLRKLAENNKIKNAILAIDSNDKKLKETKQNIKKLTDIELSAILLSFKPEKTEEKNKKLEQEKMRLVSMKILEHIVKQGNVWHLGELTSSLKEESKKIVLDVCLESIDNYCKNNNKNVSESTKSKFVIDMFRTMDISYDDKYNKIDELKQKGLFTDTQTKDIRQKLEQEQIEKQNEEIQNYRGI